MIFKTLKSIRFSISSTYDDGSFDNTSKTLDIYKLKYSNIKIFKNKKNSNSSSLSFYKLILLSNLNNYDYVTFADQDDIFCKDKFYKQILSIESGKNYLGCSTSVKTFGGSNRVLSQSSNVNKYDFLFEGAGQGCTFLLKSKFMLEVKKFIKHNYNLVCSFYFHDWLIYLLCRSFGGNWHFIEEPYLNYRIHNSNNVGDKYSLRGSIFRAKRLLNSWYFNQFIIANKLANIANNQTPLLFKMNFLNFTFLIIRYGRRKKLDRFLSFISLTFNYLKNFIIKKI